jgi:Domain of unknown function (DUF397)
MMFVSEPDHIVWRKSSYSGGNGDCVEVGWPADAVAVRDSKNPDGPRLTFGADQWRAFLTEVRHG